MTDGPFKSMTPDPSSQKSRSNQPAFRCQECQKWVYLGDWPFCGPTGHKR